MLSSNQQAALILWHWVGPLVKARLLQSRTFFLATPAQGSSPLMPGVLGLAILIVAYPQGAPDVLLGLEPRAQDCKQREPQLPAP